MNEFDPALASGAKWFLPPEGLLDGSDLDIARRYIAGARADLAFFAGDETMTPEAREGHAATRPVMEALLDSQEARLNGGDTELASLLARRMLIEVDELNRGERSTVTGQAHLIGERLRQVGHVYYVPRPTGPDSPQS